MAAGSTPRQCSATTFASWLNSGSELAILQEIPLEDIAAAGGQQLALGISRMRRGEVIAISGYDGEFGIIKVFEAPETAEESRQIGLFGIDEVDEKGSSPGMDGSLPKSRWESGDGGKETPSQPLPKTGEVSVSTHDRSRISQAGVQRTSSQPKELVLSKSKEAGDGVELPTHPASSQLLEGLNVAQAGRSHMHRIIFDSLLPDPAPVRHAP